MTQRGFTLIELLVTLVVLAILITIALPSFEETVQNNRINTEQRKLLSAINLARSEASSRNQVVTIGSASGARWDDGFRIYTDDEAAGNTAYSAGTDTLIKDIAGNDDNRLQILSNGAGASFISFRSNGLLNEANDVVIAICDNRGADQGRLITINRAGRATVTSPATTCSPP